MRRIVMGVAVCALAWAGSAVANEPASQQANEPGATTRPLQPGDIGQTTVAPTSLDGPLPIAIRWWGRKAISIETFWRLDVAVDPYPEMLDGLDQRFIATPELVLLTQPTQEPVLWDGHAERYLLQPGHDDVTDHILDRPINADKPTFHLYHPDDTISPHAVRVVQIPIDDADPPAAMYLIEANGVRVLHCDSTVDRLPAKAKEAAGLIDVLILPLGPSGMSAEAGIAVLEALRPRRFVLPVTAGEDDTAAQAVREAFLHEARRKNLLVRSIRGNTIAVTRLAPGQRPPIGSPVVVLAEPHPLSLPSEVKSMLLSLREDRQTLIDELGNVTKEQLDHKPSDGTHTIRWNFEHTTARELGLFSQIYHELDPEVPVINWNPAQMPKDFTPRHPDWGPAELVRHVRRISRFTERFSYLLADAPPTLRVEGTRFSLRYLTALIVGHYQNHTTKAVHKFTLPDWPRPK